jgi:hypothetical protein
VLAGALCLSGSTLNPETARRVKLKVSCLCSPPPGYVRFPGLQGRYACQRLMMMMRWVASGGLPSHSSRSAHGDCCCCWGLLNLL